jgi:hypothetical protein
MRSCNLVCGHKLVFSFTFEVFSFHGNRTQVVLLVRAEHELGLAGEVYIVSLCIM